ncbi:MAG TPA: glycoside hydrolase family 3 C-terminal domain-containing protein [Candidatus Eremiobacteraceae bacterium]|nr:glycoside hydrolase family 3 C-terminal domain-containing protein [Candidatus Eremiobacteraceae bacterium]
MSRKLSVVIIFFLCLTAVAGPRADAADAKPPFMNPNLPIDVRVNDLVSRMTLEEKISQMGNHAPAIPRLGIPAYEWANEAIHGVALAGHATVFPQAIGLSATWDTELMHTIADTISTEARAKYNDAIAHNDFKEHYGIDFWAPNINIFRDPRWGRGQETYGEDPYLTSRMAVAYVTGMQGTDPHYFKVISTPKHFAVHSGPEVWRHTFSADVSAHDLADTYTPAFRAAITEGHADSVMCAYSAVDEVPACVSPKLEDLLRNKWGFKGYVVSDCGAIGDIFTGHGYTETLPSAAAAAVKAGTDLDCGNGYYILRYAMNDDLISQDTIDRSVKRLFEARFRLGMFDPPSRVPWSHLTIADNDTPQHRQLALRAAQESIVLLKNDHNTLPLSSGVKRIAVVGPDANSFDVLIGNYNGVPSRYTTILDGIRNRFSNTTVVSEIGSELAPTVGVPIDEEFLRPSGASPKHGLTGEYFTNDSLQGKPAFTRVDPNIDFVWTGGSPAPGVPAGPFSVRWTGDLVPATSGDYRFALRSEGTYGIRVYLDGRLVVDQWTVHSDDGLTPAMHLDAGHAYALRVEYEHHKDEETAHLLWEAPDFLDRAVSAARSADVVVAVVGLTAQLESEENNRVIPGFFGGDRTDIGLPSPQEDLLEAVAETGKPLIVVLTAGSALAVNWAQAHASAIIDAWYPGEEGGTAVADVLAGDYDPAGRLPVTFYKSVEQLPPFIDYSMANRTYRYFTEQPLYPFGYGLSYTTFRYDDATVDSREVTADGSVTVSVRATNTGSRAGDEVVELYTTHVGLAGAPIRALTAFKRINLAPSQSQRVFFHLSGRDLSTVGEDGVRRIYPGDVNVWVGGGQPIAGPGQPLSAGVETTLHITSEATLPE